MIGDAERPTVELPLIDGETVLRKDDFEQCTGRQFHPIGTLTLTSLRLFWLRHDPPKLGGTTLRYIPLKEITSAKPERSLPHALRYRLVVKSTKGYADLRLVPMQSAADVKLWAKLITERVAAAQAEGE